MTRASSTTPWFALIAATFSLSLIAGCPGGPGVDGTVDGGVNDGGNAETGARVALDQAIADLVTCAEDDPIRQIYPNVSAEGAVIGSVPIMQTLPWVDMDDELSLREEETQACADLLQEIADTCDLRRLHGEDLEVYDACDTERLVLGSRAAGEDCTDNPYACDGYCAFDNETGCSTCADLIEEGELCDYPQRCALGTECRTIDDESRCRAPSALGEPCSWESDCVDGMFCNNDDVCEEERAPGEPCDDNTSACAFGCLSNDEGMFCAEPQAFIEAEEGDACRYPYGPEGDYIGCDFYSGVTCLITDEETYEGVCTAFEFQDVGEPCDGPWGFLLTEFTYGHRLCANDLATYCHADAFSGEGGECRPRATLGETCQSASVDGITVPCADGLFCRDTGDVDDGIGECVPLGQAGDSCADGALESWSFGCDDGLDCDVDAAGGPVCVAWDDLYEQPMCTEG
jgi:hypothetical protein